MRTILLVLVLVTALANEEIDRAIERFQDVATHAHRAFDVAMLAERIKAAETIAGIAKARARNGDTIGTVLAWKEALHLDEGNAEAQAFFQALGQYEQILAEIRSVPAGVSVAGGADPGAVAPAGPGGQLQGVERDLLLPGTFNAVVQLGTIPQGTRLVFRFCDGGYRNVREQGAMQSPDLATASPDLRPVLFERMTPEAVAGTIPAGTAASPYVWTAAKDYDHLIMRLRNTQQPLDGAVRYRITLVPPQADPRATATRSGR